MITLITGGPGTGKTAWLLDQLIELRKQDQNKEIFIHGVRNLRGIAHEVIYCKSQLCDICKSIPQDYEIDKDGNTVVKPRKFVEDWPEWKTVGSLIVADEVQRIWRPRSSGSPLPLGVSALETHRHYGIDIWLVSQGPHLFDNAIRLLVGRHVHLVSRWSGRTQYEWPECKQNVQQRSDAVNRQYKLPKRVYSMYDSAEIHTKQERRKPLSFYALIASFVFAVVAVSFVGYRLNKRVSSQPDTANVSSVGIDPVVTSDSGQSVSTGDISTKEQFYSAFTPVVPGVPWSAPAYKELAKPVVMPVLAGCVLSLKSNDQRCSCYTQQGTIIDMDYASCRYQIAHVAFNPFRSEKTNVSNNGNYAQQTAKTPLPSVLNQVLN